MPADVPHIRAGADDAAPVVLTLDRPSEPDLPARRSLAARAWRWCATGWFGGAGLTFVAVFAAGLLTRVVLMLKAASAITWDGSLAGAFACGAGYDLAFAVFAVLPVVLALAVVPRNFFARRWARGLAYLAAGAVLYVLGFVVVAEWFFWDEFGARFNFIAVDYLVYTTEVVGNIRESYPMPLIFSAIGLAAALGTGVLWSSGVMTRWLDRASVRAGRRWLALAAWIAAAFVVGAFVRQDDLPAFANAYNAELAKNGPWSFFAAFRGNRLDYDAFYPTVPVDAAFARMHRTIAAAEPAAHAVAQADSSTPDLLRNVTHPGPEQRLNVVQITVESLSAGFLTRYGGTRGLTPNLDALMTHALVFDRFYATGNRTDRGMEALTLSVPPTPGRSLVKRPENSGLFTLGSVFRSKGYATAFVYGGFGYFDNMNAFFGGNGYRVVDRTRVSAGDITFANVWGACDEDLFRWLLREADQEHAAGRPFYQFAMTTSNHRPFTYPSSRIDLPPKVSGREGGVKYTDHAIGQLLAEAAKRPWFNQTIFVIVADHCASSAGKTELPVQNYHIPLVIYAPGGQVKPGIVTSLCSQVDFAPTLLGLLHWSYPSRFYGRDVLALPAGTTGRALIGNYQRVGLYRDGKLAVLQPVRRSSTFRYDESTHELTHDSEDPELINDAISYYETASWLFKHHVQCDLTDEPAERK